MQTFTPQKLYTHHHLIKDGLILIGIMACLYFGYYFWKPERLSTFNWLIPAVFFIVHLYDNISRDRLQQIIYDTTNKEVIILYRSVFSEMKEKRIPFELAKLSVYERSGKPTLMYLFKEKREVFEIRKKKDGTSTDTMKAIAQTAEENGIRVVRR